MSDAGGQRNPLPTVDVVIYDPRQGVVLIERRNEPHGWALPGGFVDCGERVEAAAVREAREETGLVVRLVSLLGVYSDPSRDPRGHTMSVVYVGLPEAGVLEAGDDAGKARFFALENLPRPIVFDHAEILADFQQSLVRLQPKSA